MSQSNLEQTLETIRQAHRLVTREPVTGAGECLRLLEECRRNCEQIREAITPGDAARLREMLAGLLPLVESGLSCCRAGLSDGRLAGAGYQPDGSPSFPSPAPGPGTLA